MKRILTGLLLLTLLLALAACGETAQKAQTEAPTAETTAAPTTAEATTVPPETTAPTPPEVDYDRQLQFIANSFEQWKASDPYSLYGYAITDLDGNGRLELLTTVNMGSGIYSYTQIWEMSESLDVLILCETPYSEYDSQVDFTTDTYRAFVTEDAIYYLVDDNLRMGAAEGYQLANLISLKDAALSARYLGMRATTHLATGEQEITYSDANDTPLSEEEFSELLANAVPDAVEKTAHFEITYLSEEEINALDAQGWLEILTNSWEKFSVE